MSRSHNSRPARSGAGGGKESTVADQWRNRETGEVVTYIGKSNIVSLSPSARAPLCVLYARPTGVHYWPVYGDAKCAPWAVAWEPVR